MLNTLLRGGSSNLTIMLIAGRVKKKLSHMHFNLFMINLGCKPKGRTVEQHDTFFGISNSLVNLVPAIKNFWPEAEGKIHIDAWRHVTLVEGCLVKMVVRGTQRTSLERQEKLFFVNLGGYKRNDFEEYHSKILVLAKNKTEAIQKAKLTPFFLNTGFDGAPSHIDDKYGIDIDDIEDVEDLLPKEIRAKYRIKIMDCHREDADLLHQGYLALSKIK